MLKRTLYIHKICYCTIIYIYVYNITSLLCMYEIEENTLLQFHGSTGQKSATCRSYKLKKNIEEKKYHQREEKDGDKGR